LLSFEDAQDVPVFDRPELFRSDIGVAAGVQYFLWTQQAADVIGPVGKCHA
jgi:hypothetical protein